MKFHFIGIKGSGMSSLAQVLFDLGYEVQGSDKEKHFFTQIALEKRGIKILPYDENNITKNLIVIVGASIKDDHPELIKTKELGLERYQYYEFLGKLTNEYNTIAICGCHGKTTTTGLLSHVFTNTIGANYLIGDGTGYANKDNTYFIIEACEYYRHFLHYYPKTTIITNIELDHVDYYKDLEDIKDAYISFINQTEKQVIACGDDENILSIKDRINKDLILYGINDNNDFIAKNIVSSEDGNSFDVYYKDQFLYRFDLNLFGQHMILNALAVISTCYLEGISMEDVQKSLKVYHGVKRRFTERQVHNTILIDDYAHHPTEIKSLINATKQKYPHKKIIGVLYPHTFSRTSIFYKEIAEILNTIDKSYIMDIYPSREKQEDFPDVTSKLIVDLLNNGEHITHEEIDKLSKYKDSVIIFMSPDDLSEMINKVENLLQ